MKASTSSCRSGPIPIMITRRLPEPRPRRNTAIDTRHPSYLKGLTALQTYRSAPNRAVTPSFASEPCFLKDSVTVYSNNWLCPCTLFSLLRSRLPALLHFPLFYLVSGHQNVAPLPSSPCAHRCASSCNTFLRLPDDAMRSVAGIASLVFPPFSGLL